MLKEEIAYKALNLIIAYFTIFHLPVFPAPNAVSWTEEQGSCMADKPYKIWFIETANECKTTCAEESKCKMVKYSPQERKCYFSFSSELTPYKKCMVKYDFYTKGIYMQTITSPFIEPHFLKTCVVRNNAFSE